MRPGQILLLDNASTDDTQAWIESGQFAGEAIVNYVRLPENIGGAGGFAEGVKLAMASGADWIWMMDDDAEPHPRALEELMVIASDPPNVYGSLAVNGEETSWVTTLLDGGPRAVDRAAEVPAKARVQSLQFLGFLIHRELVGKIGLPDASYFIAADDVEYCLRAERAGAKIFIAGKSRIEHPKSSRYIAILPGRRLICLRLPPWKRYYDTRNRLLVAREYYGIRLLTQTLPGLFMRIVAAMLHEPLKGMQLWSFTAGLVDGLLGRRGRLHSWWRIPQ